MTHPLLTRPAATPRAQPAIEARVAQDAPLRTGAPIFISGCNRGGTTVVSQLLAAHPDVRNIGRSQFNEGQYIWRRRYPDWSRHRWALPPWVWYLRRDERSAKPEVLRFFRDAFGAEMPGPGRMLEKTPANAVRIPLIDRLYPDCFFVHVLRDGRHTTASLIARRVFPLYAPHQWVRAHRIALGDLSRLPAERVVRVRYEELMEDPRWALERLCRHTRLRWDQDAAAAVESTAERLLREPDSRWDRLPSVVRRYSLRVIAELQQELGYPLEG